MKGLYNNAGVAVGGTLGVDLVDGLRVLNLFLSSPSTCGSAGLETICCITLGNETGVELPSGTSGSWFILLNSLSSMFIHES